MITLIVNDTKDFMRALTKSPIFNNFLLHTLIIEHTYRLTLEGQSSLASTQKNTECPFTFVPFPTIQPTFLYMIQQAKPPIHMKLILLLSSEATQSIQLRTLGETTSFPIQHFFLTFLYEEEKIKVTTGINYADFTLDKSCEHAFDVMIRKFFLKNNLSLSEPI